MTAHGRRLDAEEVKRRHVVGPDVGVALRIPSLTLEGITYLVADAYRAAKLALEEDITAEEALRKARKP